MCPEFVHLCIGGQIQGTFCKGFLKLSFTCITVILVLWCDLTSELCDSDFLVTVLKALIACKAKKIAIES